MSASKCVLLCVNCTPRGSIVFENHETRMDSRDISEFYQEYKSWKTMFHMTPYYLNCYKCKVMIIITTKTNDPGLLWFSLCCLLITKGVFLTVMIWNVAGMLISHSGDVESNPGPATAEKKAMQKLFNKLNDHKLRRECTM